ncbi:hypothetical protein BDY21DRAFT_330436 [Lineolata rhizophorae]|uniref:Uncharacterized protein n=1 Tax=Lineolata rhizophorae TaxID=578093 RepID=A0A6A6PE91_9PEZI|nr:hypothetical protein BDY21DRAFT_330436 [Lineolata rhizophorae]
MPHRSESVERGGRSCPEQEQYVTHGSVIGLERHIERVVSECEKLKNVLKTPCKDVDPFVERNRHEARRANSQIIESDRILHILPTNKPKQKEDGTPVDVPKTGKEIRDLDHSKADSLLDMYEIPYLPNMFLHEKKELYLRFIDASGDLMHRVLD